MPFLKQQIQIVNNLLRATALADKRFDAGRFETLAVDCLRKDSEGKIEGFPAIMSENYEAQEVTVNDTYPIVIYHKALQKRYDKIPAGQFGDRDKGVSETVLVKMVVYAKYSAVKLRQEQLEALITTNFPDNIPDVLFKTEFKLFDLAATMRSSNLNSAAVWNEEYKGIDLALAPEDIYFSINYELNSTWKKGCFKICDCE